MGQMNIKLNRNIYKYYNPIYSMTRIRRTRKWGDSKVIVLAPTDDKDMNIEIGKDQVDIENIRILKDKKEVNKNGRSPKAN